MTVREFHALRRKAKNLGLTVKKGTDTKTLRELLKHHSGSGNSDPSDIKSHMPDDIKRAFRIARREAPNAVRRIEKWLKEVLCQ